MNWLRSILLEGEGGSGAGAGGGNPNPDPTAFDFRTVLNEKGEFSQGWQEKLPKDYDGVRATLANFKDFGGLSKSLLENMTAARAKNEGMVKMPVHPGDKATKEQLDAYTAERDAFFKTLGRPDKPEGYGLKAPDKLPEGLEWDKGFADGFTAEAHKLGLSKAQVEGLGAWHLAQMMQQHQSMTTEGTRATEAETAKLRQTFGENFEKRTLDAKRAAMTLGLPEDHPIFWRADTVIAMAKLADMMGEDKLVSKDAMGNKLSPGTQASDIIQNPDNADHKAYHDPGHARHKEVVAFVNAQLAKQYPGK